VGDRRWTEETLTVWPKGDLEKVVEMKRKLME
jgi:hypothetical protein